MVKKFRVIDDGNFLTYIFFFCAQAGGRELAILILLFSGIWPYTKQLVSLVLWFLPPSALSVSRRGNVFMWLDALAKWSMVDIFVLILTIAGFRVSVKRYVEWGCDLSRWEREY